MTYPNFACHFGITTPNSSTGEIDAMLRTAMLLTEVQAMGIQETMQRRVQRVVEPNEHVHACFQAAGHNPKRSPKPPQYIVAVTDRSIRIYTSKKWPRLAPRELIQVSPHQWLAEPSALDHAQIEIGGRPLWIAKKFHPDVQHANQSMRLA